MSLARGNTRNRGYFTVFVDSILLNDNSVKSLFDLLDENLFSGVKLISFFKINLHGARLIPQQKTDLLSQ